MLVLFCTGIDSHKFMQPFDWNWVNEKDFRGDSSFFSQIPSFQLLKSHYFENFPFRAHFMFYWNSDSHKFLQLFDWKWVNEQDFVGGLSFFSQILSFRPMRWVFSKFLFRCSFYFVLELKFTQICAAFQLEIGQQARLRKSFIVFQPNSIVSASEMTFFQRLSIRCSFYFASEF